MRVRVTAEETAKHTYDWIRTRYVIESRTCVTPLLSLLGMLNMGIFFGFRDSYGLSSSCSPGYALLRLVTRDTLEGRVLKTAREPNHHRGLERVRRKGDILDLPV